MHLTFLGTRAFIEASSRRHRRHSAALVETDGGRLMIDCGADWRGRIGDIDPDAIVLTHAHPDHAFGLADGGDRPVWATEATWHGLAEAGITAPCGGILVPERRIVIAGIGVAAFPVVHSTRAPAVGLKLDADGRSVFYVPDVVDIEDRAAALDGVDLYVGDGSSPTRSLVRRAGGALVGHTTVRAQLGWLGAAGIGRARFTHCGSAVVTGDERRLGPALTRMARARGVAEARYAHDRETLRLS